MSAAAGFGAERAVIGMLHLSPLPGTPFYRHDYQQNLDRAVAGAVALAAGGARGCLVQTVDGPYSTKDDADAVRVSAMSNIVRAVKAEVPAHFDVGLQIMRNAIKASLAVATCSGGSFIRAGALVGVTLSDDGFVHADPHSVLQYRKQIAADNIAIIAEIDSMHFKWWGEVKTTGEVALLASSVGAAAVSLGHPDQDTMIAMIADVRAKAPATPIYLAGYTNHANAGHLMLHAAGAFVGTCFEEGGWGSGVISVAKVREYMDVVEGLPPLETSQP